MKAIHEQTILITGATDGLGKQVALDLAAQGANLLLHGRSPEKGRATLAEIQKTTGNPKLRYYNADFASLAQVRELAGEIQADQPRLDVLINNAGLGAKMRSDPRELSADGYELRFTVNYLSHFLLTWLLLPLLRKSAPARVINVASIGQVPIDFDDVMLENGYDGFRAYRQSKLAQVMFTIDLAEKLKGSGVTVNSLHPASLMNTKMVLDTDYFSAPLSTIPEGAQAVEYLATSPEAEGVSGEFYNGMEPSRANTQVYDPELRSRLWNLSAQLTQIDTKTV